MQRWQCPIYLYLIKYLDDIVILLDFKFMNFDIYILFLIRQSVLGYRRELGLSI